VWPAAWIAALSCGQHGLCCTPPCKAISIQKSRAAPCQDKCVPCNRLSTAHMCNANVANAACAFSCTLRQEAYFQAAHLRLCGLKLRQVGAGRQGAQSTGLHAIACRRVVHRTLCEAPCLGAGPHLAREGQRPAVASIQWSAGLHVALHDTRAIKRPCQHTPPKGVGDQPLLHWQAVDGRCKLTKVCSTYLTCLGHPCDAACSVHAPPSESAA
jgi:hypothetical protein